jgi:hypothetical protein
MSPLRRKPDCTIIDAMRNPDGSWFDVPATDDPPRIIPDCSHECLAGISRTLPNVWRRPPVPARDQQSRRKS